MGSSPIRFCSIHALALLLIAPQAMAMDSVALAPSTAEAMALAASPQAIAEYRRQLREYQEARAAFEAEAGAYWSSIIEKRRGPDLLVDPPGDDFAPPLGHPLDPGTIHRWRLTE